MKKINRGKKSDGYNLGSKLGDLVNLAREISFLGSHSGDGRVKSAMVDIELYIKDAVDALREGMSDG